MRVNGNVAIVTGASSGLGAELSRQLAQAGWKVGLVARRAVELGRVAEVIRREGGTAEVAPADVTDPGATAAAIRRIVRLLGPIDLMVANAGVGIEVSARNFSTENFTRMVEVNLIGTSVAIENVLPTMIQRGSGQIVGISSLAGYRGLPGAAGYSATKAGLTAFLEGLRPELIRLGIAVTVVHPGYVRTPMTAGATHPQPFLMEVEPAVRIILKGILQRKARVDFPWPMATFLSLVRILPSALYDPLVARVLLGPDRSQRSQLKG